MSRRRVPSDYNPTLAELTHHEIAGVRCWCLKCHRYKVLPLDRLFAHLGRDFPYHDLAPRLRCTCCGARGAQTQPDWPLAPREIDLPGPCRWQSHTEN